MSEKICKKGKYWLGKKLSKETKEKMRLAHLGKPHPIVRISRGYKLSEETKSKMSISRTGKVFSEETRQKLRNRKGVLSGNWQGGKTNKTMIIRNSFEYKKWRNLVFERDGYKCIECNRGGSGLEAHHIKSFAEYPELRFLVENGITYCKKCHAKHDPIRNRSIKKELPIYQVSALN